MHKHSFTKMCGISRDFLKSLCCIIVWITFLSCRLKFMKNRVKFSSKKIFNLTFEACLAIQILFCPILFLAHAMCFFVRKIIITTKSYKRKQSVFNIWNSTWHHDQMICSFLFICNKNSCYYSYYIYLFFTQYQNKALPKANTYTDTHT